MATWIKRAVLVAVFAVPVLGYAASKYHRASCPVTPDCPCEAAR